MYPYQNELEMPTNAQKSRTTVAPVVPNNASQDYAQWHLPEGASARLGKGEVNDVKFSPDSTLLAVATSIGIWLYNAHTGEEITLLPQPKQVNVLAFSHDGKTLASGESEYQGYESAVRLWDIETGNMVSDFTGKWKEIKALAYTSDGTKLVIAGGSSEWREEIWTWNPTEGTHQENVVDLDHKKGVPGLMLVLSPGSRFLASIVKPNNKRNCTIELWDIDSGRQLSTLRVSPDRFVSTVTFSPDGKTVATAHSDQIQFWDIESGRLCSKLNVSTQLFPLVYSPDGSLIASGNRDGEMQLWKVPTDNITSILQHAWGAIVGKNTCTFWGHAEYFRFSAIAFSRDSKMVASANSDGTVRVWKIDTGIEEFTLIQHIGGVNALAFSQTDSTLTSLSLKLGQISASVWNTDTGKELSTEIIDEGHAGNEAVVITPDGKLFAIESTDEIVRLWDGTTKQFLSVLKGKNVRKGPRSYFAQKLVFSPDNKILARGHGDGTIQLWDVENRRPLPTLKGHTGNFHRLVFAPDSKTLASTNSDATTRLWDVSTNTELAIFEGEERRRLALAFSPDGKTFANGVDVFRIGDASGSYLHLYRLQEVKFNLVAGLTFSPDTKILVGSGFGKIQMWDASTGELLSALTVHTGWIDELVFSPDSTILASRSEYDGTILLWNWEKIAPRNE